MTDHITKDEAGTRALAANLARSACKCQIYALSGDLGAGKSAFARGFIQALLGNIDVPSPTFTLVQGYETEKGPLYHFDLYRLEDPEEVLELGWEDAIADGICLIEWPDRAGSFLPKNATSIIFTTLPDESRKISIHDPSSH